MESMGHRLAVNSQNTIGEVAWMWVDPLVQFWTQLDKKIYFGLESSWKEMDGSPHWINSVVPLFKLLLRVKAFQWATLYYKYLRNVTAFNINPCPDRTRNVHTHPAVGVPSLVVKVFERHFDGTRRTLLEHKSAFTNWLAERKTQNLKAQLWFHVDATQGGLRTHYVLASTPRAWREPPENVNLASRRRSSEGCDWSAH